MMRDVPSWPAYWRRHAREPVRFRDGMASLVEAGYRVFLEVGPRPALLGLARQSVADSGCSWIPSLRPGAEWPEMLEALATLYVLGADVDWDGFDRDYGRTRVDLPTYPFQRERYWSRPTRVALPADPASADEGRENVVESRAALFDLIQGGARSPARVFVDAVGFESDPEGGAELLGKGLLGVEWRDCPEGLLPATTAPPAGRWLVVADTGGLGAALADRLQSLGVPCRLLRELPADDAAFDGQTGIVHLQTLDAREDAPDAQGACRMLALVQRLAAVAPACTLWVVTRGAQPASADPVPLAVAQAPVWGLGRTVSLEHGTLWGGLVDVDPSAAIDEQAAQIVRTIAARCGEDHVAYRDGVPRVPRIVPQIMDPASAAGPAIQSAATYLITGGLGAIGLLLASWLVRRGARHLVLTSRGTSRSDEAARAIAAFERAGAEILVETADVADAGAMSALIRRLAGGDTPLRGVIHAAGVTIPRLVTSMTGADLEAVLRPKVQGAWMLHEATRSLPLDFLVLFSSVASVWGSGGLGNYAAANHFLDTLAHHRRALGLPCLCVNWGPWDAGMMAPEELTILRTMGIRSLPAASAVGALERLMASGRTQAVVADVDWSRFRPVYEARGARPLVSELGGGDADGHAAAPGELAARLAGMRDAERSAFFVDLLAREIARCLRMSVEELPIDQPMTEIGMDSLVVMEVLAACRRDLGLALYPRDFFAHPTIQDFAAFLERELSASAGTSAAPASPTRDASAVLDRLQADAAASFAPVTRRNAPAAFLLSSPRSGSTLLRVMLAGHPALFCPPELHLLPFQTMADRAARLEGSYLGEGLERAVMALRGVGPDEAKALCASWSRAARPVQDVYAELQDLASPRLLVDKSPSYAGSAIVLDRGDQLFDAARYVHLVRHPYAVLESFARVRIDRLLGADGVDPWSLAEQVWTASTRHALDLGRRVGGERYLRVQYEELVREPRASASALCAFLGVPPDEAVLDPYAGGRMTGGLYASSASIGDPNFLRHSAIEPELADAWRRVELPRPLSAEAASLAEELGYELSGRDRPAVVAGGSGAAVAAAAGDAAGDAPILDDGLYGLDAIAADAIREEGHVILVDTPEQVSAARAGGLLNVVTAIGGGRDLSSAQVRRLASMTDLILGLPRESEARALLPAWPSPGTLSLAGELRLETMRSADGQPPLDYAVYLPSTAATVSELPLLVFLQGAERSPQLFVLLERLMLQQLLSPMVVVVPDGGRNLCVNRRDGRDDWESTVVERVIPAVRGALGLGGGLLGIGLSQGGLGILRMALRRPGLFRAVAAHAPAIEEGFTFADVPGSSVLRMLRPPAVLEDVFGRPVDGDGYWTANHPPSLARANAERLRASGLRIHLDCGQGDRIARPGTEFLARVLAGEGIDCRFTLVEGGRHNRAYFTVAVLEGLTFLDAERRQP